MHHFNPPQSESDLIAQILLSFSNGPTRLWRVNAGLAWQGKVIEHSERRLVLLNPRCIRMGCEGMSDLIGIGPGGVFLAPEAKFGRNQATEAQFAFQRTVNMLGGRSGVVRSLDDVAQLIGV